MVIDGILKGLPLRHPHFVKVHTQKYDNSGYFSITLYHTP